MAAKLFLVMVGFIGVLFCMMNCGESGVRPLPQTTALPCIDTITAAAAMTAFDEASNRGVAAAKTGDAATVIRSFKDLAVQCRRAAAATAPAPTVTAALTKAAELYDRAASSCERDNVNAAFQFGKTASASVAVATAALKTDDVGACK